MYRCLHSSVKGYKPWRCTLDPGDLDGVCKHLIQLFIKNKKKDGTQGNLEPNNPEEFQRRDFLGAFYDSTT